MLPEKNQVEKEPTNRINVKRARELSDKLASLTPEDLRLLKRFSEDPKSPGLHQILAKAVLTEYSIHELRVALAMLSGTGSVDSIKEYVNIDSVEAWEPSRYDEELPPAKLPLVEDDNIQMPSPKLSAEISMKLSAMPHDEFIWLAEHINDPMDSRCLFLRIRYHLYKYSHEDLAATIATLLSLNRYKYKSKKKTDLADFRFNF